MEHTSPYKTAAKLGIADWEHEGLIALIGPLSRGELEIDMYSDGREGEKCGTVACIGGWVAIEAGLRPDTYVRYGSSKSLTGLFYPGCRGESGAMGWGANAPQAAQAIVNFLMLGDPKWDDVMFGA